MAEENPLSDTIQLANSVPVELDGLRVDQVLAQLFSDYSRTKLTTWLKQGDILVDGVELRPRDKVSSGQKIQINTVNQPISKWQGQPLELNIVAEDESFIIVNKPAGQIVHPGAGNPDNTLVNALLHYAPELDLLPRAGIVHRLDKNTTGLLIVARTLVAQNKLFKQMQARDIKREYLAVVHKLMIAGGKVDAPIGRHPTQRTKMAIVKSGKHAITHYRVKEKFRAHMLLSVHLQTGRTHQIRVHMSHIHHPIVGDPQYGRGIQIPINLSDQLSTSLTQFNRQALHACHISFKHPLTDLMCQYTASAPDDMEQLINLLRKDILHAITDD